jgi:hypothetical protein
VRLAEAAVAHQELPVDPAALGGAEKLNQVAGLAIQFVINGDGTSIHCTPQSAADGGINVNAAGPATVAGVRGRATSGQCVQAGRDATMARAGDHPSGKGWWTRLRERGVVVTIAIIIGAIAAGLGTAVAICAWAGWTP